jgi:hypothetical protein
MFGSVRRMTDDHRTDVARTVDLSVGIVLAFFFWMMIPLAVIVTMWISFGDGFHRVHLLQAYPAVAQTNVAARAISTESKRQAKVAPAHLASNTPRNSQRGPRHVLLARGRHMGTAAMAMGFADNTSDGGLSSPFSSLFADHGAIH